MLMLFNIYASQPGQIIDWYQTARQHFADDTTVTHSKESGVLLQRHENLDVGKQTKVQ